MKPNYAQSAADELSRVATASEDARALWGASKPSSSRAQLLATLQATDTEFSIEELSHQTGLHVNTVRAHLDVLVAGGHVVRIHGEPKGRGRPPFAFRAAGDSRSPFDDLSRTLTEALDVANQPELARSTAERWAETLGPLPTADTPDEAVEHAVESLRTVGFSAEASILGDSITVGTCPYASLIADHPVICDIHTELLATVLNASGQDVGVEAMDVWVKPTLCRARLTRPDISPARSITVSPADLVQQTHEEDQQ